LTTATTHTTDHLHAAFLTILPRIQLHGRVFFRTRSPKNARR
jgi:hypothetical protein